MAILRAPRRTSRSTLRATLRLVLAVAGVAWMTLPAQAASPSPSASQAPSEDPAPNDMGLEVWLDAPLPADAKVGRTIDIGATIWDTRANELARTMGAYLKLYPLVGDADPTEAATRSEWPGHVRSSVVVPEGGAGRIEIGFRGQECHDDGTCRPVDLPIADGGIGPPPAASRSLLVNAAFRQPVDPLVAGRPIALELTLEPRAAWDLGLLALPDRLVATASRVRGPELASAELRRAGTRDTVYTGSITIPESGDVVLRAALLAGPANEPIPSSTIRLQLAAPGDGFPGPARDGDPGDPAIPIPLVVGGLAAAIAAALVFRRAFADL